MDISQSVPRMVKRQKKSFKEKKKGKDSLKVVYISSPMKVKTSASRFMSLVQALTGKNSDIAQYTELNDEKVIHEFLEIDLNDGALVTQEETSDQYNLSSISNSNDTATCNSSNSFFERVHEGLITSQREEQFAEIFGSNSFCDPYLVDVLGSYDEL